MKITFEREKLHSAFQTAASVAPARSPKPILQNVKLDATNDGVILMATDLEVGIRINVQGVTVEQPGSAVLPIARFGPILRECTDEKLYLESDSNGSLVRGDRSKWNLPGENPDEFPNVV
ncbi:MAG TPA: DNA polymerase III subunit beta, partial [Pirellulales bacterium]